MPPKRFDATVIGAAGVDTNVYLYGNDVDFNVEANFSQNIDYVGQAGGYSARLFSQLGKRTAYIGAVGHDFLGDFVVTEMKRDGIDTSGIFIDPWGTKRSVNFMYQDGRRKNFYDGKGAMEIHPDLDTARDILSRTKIAHFSIVNWTRYLLPIAKEAGNIISCDIQDVVAFDDEYRRDYILAADVLFFSSANFHDPTPLINHFLHLNPSCVVICGMGKDGCALGMRVREETPDGKTVIGNRNEINFFPAVNIDRPIIDTNGAGDSLAVGFLTSYFLDGYSLDASILRAQVTARYTCSLKASTAEFITPPQLDEYFKKLQ